MNKRIKKKQKSIEINKISKVNKQLMKTVIKRLRAIGLHPYNITYPGGYFFFQNQSGYEIMHFQLKELPEFLFSVWNKRLTLSHPTREVRMPIIFGERLCILDKFKPSRAEWTPLYDQFVQHGKEVPISEFWNTIDELKHFVNEPWSYLHGETKEEYFNTIQYDERKKEFTQKVKECLYEKIKDKLKEQQVSFGLIVPNPYFQMNHLILMIEDTVTVDVSTLLDSLYDYVNFDISNEIEQIIEQLNCSEYVNSYQSEFDVSLSNLYQVPKEVIEQSKTMTYRELNNTYCDLFLPGSNFSRLIVD